jgi:hypothetical protein
LGQLTIIGHQYQTLTLKIQAAHGIKAFTDRHQAAYSLARITLLCIHRGKHIARFMQGNVNLLLSGFNRPTIQCNAIRLRIGLLANFSNRTIDTYSTCDDILFAIAPGTEPGLG